MGINGLWGNFGIASAPLVAGVLTYAVGWKSALLAFGLLGVSGWLRVLRRSLFTSAGSDLQRGSSVAGQAGRDALSDPLRGHGLLRADVSGLHHHPADLLREQAGRSRWARVLLSRAQLAGTARTAPDTRYPAGHADHLRRVPDRNDRAADRWARGGPLRVALGLSGLLRLRRALSRSRSDSSRVRF